MSSNSARKELNELGRLIRQNGFKLAPGGKGKHMQILQKKGNGWVKLVDEHGPVILSTTPSDFRARDLAAARLIRAGAVREDQLPWKPTQKKEREPGGLLLAEDDGPDSPGARKRLKQLNESQARNERTQEIRGRLEPLVGRIGGWGKRGLISEMGDVLYHHSKDSPFAFPSKQAAKANATSLRKGGTLSDDKAGAWEALLETLESVDLPREAWYDLVRAARGLSPRVKPVVAYSAGSVVEGERSGARKTVYQQPVGKLNEEMEREYGNGKPAEVIEHPLFEMHRDGGLRWRVEFTDNVLNEMNRAIGFFEGLAVQLSFFDGQELVEPALARMRAVVDVVSEARFRELAARGKVEGA